MKIRTATDKDLDAIFNTEAICFPPNEAASMDAFSKRLKVFPQHFWLLEDDGALIGHIDGMVTDNETIMDEMFKNAGLHNEGGSWQTVLGLAILPEHQSKGYAGKLLDHLAKISEQQGRKGVILTCKKGLIPFYEKFGFKNTGLSKSTHGGEIWFDMRKTF